MGLGKLFNKITHGANKFFGKGGEGSKILGKVSSTLGQVGNVANQIASSPIVAATLGPEANILAGGIGSVANEGSSLTKQSNYHGNSQQVQNNILERAQNIKDTVNSHPAFA